MDNIHVVEDILASTKSLRGTENDMIDSRLPRKGFTYVGIPGLCTALIGAMVVGSPDVVEVLLQNGADPYLTGKNGNCPLMCACVYGRLDNVRMWIERFQNWDLEKRSKIGGTALGCAVYMGPNRLNLVKYLLKKGAKVDHTSYNGTSNFVSACSNEDADPRVVQLLLEQCSQHIINARIRPRNAK